MKKLLLIGIAALCLATGTAHAVNHDRFRCGEAFVDTAHNHGTAPDGTRVFPRTWTIIEDGNLGAALKGLSSINFRCNKTQQKCWLNGKLCRNMSDEEWYKEFPDAD